MRSPAITPVRSVITVNVNSTAEYIFQSPQDVEKIFSSEIQSQKGSVIIEESPISWRLLLQKEKRILLGEEFFFAGYRPSCLFLKDVLSEIAKGICKYFGTDLTVSFPDDTGEAILSPFENQLFPDK